VGWIGYGIGCRIERIALLVWMDGWMDGFV